jgi:hypothetical protein
MATSRKMSVCSFTAALRTEWRGVAKRSLASRPNLLKTFSLVAEKGQDAGR